MPRLFDPCAVDAMPRFLSSSQVQKLLGISRQSLSLHVRCGRIHANTTLTGRRLYPASQFAVAADDELQAILDYPVSLDEIEAALRLYRDPAARAAAEAAHKPPPPKRLDSRQNRFSNEPFEPGRLGLPPPQPPPQPTPEQARRVNHLIPPEVPSLHDPDYRRARNPF